MEPRNGERGMMALGLEIKREDTCRRSCSLRLGEPGLCLDAEDVGRGGDSWLGGGQPGCLGGRGHWCAWCWTYSFWMTEGGRTGMPTGPHGLRGLSLLMGLVCSAQRPREAGTAGPVLGFPLHR